MAHESRPTTHPRRFASRTSVAVALCAAAICVAGVVLSGPAWTSPATQGRPGLADEGSTLTFSYRADVPLTPAYEGTTVAAPDPLFRALIDTVRLSYAYSGPPGTIRLDAEISSPNGWHTRVPLQSAVRFEEPWARGHVDLDLDELDERAAAAAALIGMPIDQVTVEVVPTVHSADGETFAPRLAFALTPTQLRLASERPQLEFRQRAEPSVSAPGPASLEIAGQSVELSAVRLGVGGLSAIALGVLLWILLPGWRLKGDEPRLCPSRYRGVLEVEAIISPPGRPIVEVRDYGVLARLARRYGVLIMHWTREQVRTFEVHDDGVTYRYRVDVAPSRTS